MKLCRYVDLVEIRRVGPDRFKAGRAPPVNPVLPVSHNAYIFVCLYFYVCFTQVHQTHDTGESEGR